MERLQKAQQQVLTSQQTQMAHLETIIANYKTLKETLTSLTKSFQMSAYVPFANSENYSENYRPKCLLEAKLIHTNEVMVLLGAGYFVETTSFKATKIIDGRVKSLEQDIEKFKNSQDQVEKHQEFTREFKTEEQKENREEGQETKYFDNFDQEENTPDTIKPKVFDGRDKDVQLELDKLQQKRIRIMKDLDPEKVNFEDLLTEDEDSELETDNYSNTSSRPISPIEIIVNLTNTAHSDPARHRKDSTDESAPTSPRDLHLNRNVVDKVSTKISSIKPVGIRPVSDNVTERTMNEVEKSKKVIPDKPKRVSRFKQGLRK